MGESYDHIRLVEQLHHATQARCELYADPIIYIDHPSIASTGKPPKIGNSIPDLLLRAENPNCVFIGEAKTARDVETPHTQSQFEDYLQYLSREQGAFLLVITPWVTANAARALLSLLQRRLDCQNVIFEVLVGDLE